MGKLWKCLSNNAYALLEGVEVEVRHILHMIWVGGEVGESRRTVNPFLIGEWVRLPPCPPVSCERIRLETLIFGLVA